MTTVSATVTAQADYFASIAAADTVYEVAQSAAQAVARTGKYRKADGMRKAADRAYSAAVAAADAAFDAAEGR